MIEPMKAKQSLKAAELQDGDIVCFQRAVDGKSSDSDKELVSQFCLALQSTNTNRSVKSGHADRIEDARVFYDFLLHRRHVRFYPSPRNTDFENLTSFDLTLSAKHTYDQVAAKVGDHLNVDQTHLRFWTVNATTNNPKTSVKRGQAQILQTILNPPYSTFSNNNQRADSLYFEILDMSLAELDTKKLIKVWWLSEGISKEEEIHLLVPKTGIVEDLVAALIKKAQLEDESKAGPIRVYEIHSNKISKEYPRTHTATSIGDNAHVIVERIPEEDLDAPGAELLHSFHYQNEPSKSHGIPFRFRIKEVSERI
jgi:ubiquitin carboxyl-terminal hydrolase 7